MVTGLKSLDECLRVNTPSIPPTQEQECIPVGCVPPALYRTGGLCPGGGLSKGSLSGGLCQGGSLSGRPPVSRMTDRQV